MVRKQTILPPLFSIVFLLIAYAISSLFVQMQVLAYITLSAGIFPVLYYLNYKLTIYTFDPSPEFWQELSGEEDRVAIRREHLLVEWWRHQQRSWRSVLVDLPSHPMAFNVTDEYEGSLFEVEGEAEYFKISTTESFVPWSRIRGVEFFSEPIDVPMPEVYTNRDYAYPLEDSVDRRICFNCGGDGTIRCSRCMGTGEVDCSSCHGSGTRRTTDHDSEGNMVWVDEDCPWCFNGEERCSRCSGRGYVTCGDCEGEGELGHFLVKTWHFIHWVKPEVLLQEKGEVRSASIPDLPNNEAMMLRDYSSDHLEELTQTYPNRASIHERLMEKTKELQREINSLPNMMFNSFTYRFMPKITLKISYQNQKFTLVGRGYYPVNHSISNLPNLPLDRLRVLVTGVVFGLGNFILYTALNGLV